MVIPGPLPDLRLIDMMLAFRWMGTPYCWAGQSLIGGDCSGFQIWRFRQWGLIKLQDDYTAQGLWGLLQDGGRIGAEKLGALSVYGKSFQEIVHCAYCLGEGLTIDAIGTSYINTPELAKKAGAYFRIMRVDRRPDLLGFVDPFRYLHKKQET